MDMDLNLCPLCEGRGDIRTATGRMKCPRCDGTGIVNIGANELTNGSHATAGKPSPPTASVPAPAPPQANRSFHSLPIWLLALFSLLTTATLIWAVLARPKALAPFYNVNNGNSSQNINVNYTNPTNTIPPDITPGSGTAIMGTTVVSTPSAPGQPSVGVTPTPGMSMSPTPGGGKSPTATSVPPTDTPTPAPLLDVSPQTIHVNLCVAGSGSFTVSNQGGGTLQWKAKASNLLYMLSSAQGSLAGSYATTVRVNNITLNGSIAVSGNGGSATVTVTCG